MLPWKSLMARIWTVVDAPDASPPAGCGDRVAGAQAHVSARNEARVKKRIDRERTAATVVDPATRWPAPKADADFRLRV